MEKRGVDYISRIANSSQGNFNSENATSIKLRNLLYTTRQNSQEGSLEK
jgi:hypothetical protein